MKTIATFLCLTLAAALFAAPAQAASDARARAEAQATIPADDSGAWYLTLFAADDQQAAALQAQLLADPAVWDIAASCHWNVITPQQRRFEAYASQLGGYLPAVVLQEPTYGIAKYFNYGSDCTADSVANELPLSYENCGVLGFGRRGSGRRSSGSYYNSNSSSSRDESSVPAGTVNAKDPPPLKFADDSESKELFNRPRPRPCPTPNPAPAPAPQPVQPVGPPPQVRPKTATTGGVPWGLLVGAAVVGLAIGLGIGVARKLRQ